MKYRQYLKPAFPKHYDLKSAKRACAIIQFSMKKQGIKPWPPLLQVTKIMVWLNLNFRNDISCIRRISAANSGAPADKVPIFARSRRVELGARAASRRFVGELALFWRRIDGLNRDGTAAWAYARFRGVEGGQDNVPGVTPFVLGGDFSAKVNSHMTLSSRLQHSSDAPCLKFEVSLSTSLPVSSCPDAALQATKVDPVPINRHTGWQKDPSPAKASSRVSPIGPAPAQLVRGDSVLN